MSKEYDIELIDRYFKNELSDSEKASFEERLKSDTDFAKEFELVKDLKKASKLFLIEDFKKKVQQVSDTYENEVKEEVNQGSKKTGFSFLKIAATIIIVVGIASIVWYINPFQNDQETTPVVEEQNEQDSVNYIKKNMIISQIPEESYGFVVPDSMDTRNMNVYFSYDSLYKDSYHLSDTGLIIGIDEDFDIKRAKIFEKTLVFIYHMKGSTYVIDKENFNSEKPIKLEEVKPEKNAKEEIESYSDPDYYLENNEPESTYVIDSAKEDSQRLIDSLFDADHKEAK